MDPLGAAVVMCDADGVGLDVFGSGVKEKLYPVAGTSPAQRGPADRDARNQTQPSEHHHPLSSAPIGGSRLKRALIARAGQELHSAPSIDGRRSLGVALELLSRSASSGKVRPSAAAPQEQTLRVPHNGSITVSQVPHDPMAIASMRSWIV